MPFLCGKLFVIGQLHASLIFSEGNALTPPSAQSVRETEGEESIEHILFRWSWTKAVWFGSTGKAFWVLDNPIISAGRWIEDLLAKEADSEMVGHIFQLCWANWKSRNDIFQGNLPNPVDTIRQASMAKVITPKQPF